MKTGFLNKFKKFFSKFYCKRYFFNKITKNDKIIFIYRVDLIGDYIISKDFLRLVRNSFKFKNYKIVFLGNVSIKDFILDFDKEYIDEYIALNRNLLKYNSYKKAVSRAINKYKYEYTLNYMSIRNCDSEFITGCIKSGRKCGIKGLSTNLTPEEKVKYDKLYDKLYDVTCAYDRCGLELLNKIAEEPNREYIHSYKFKHEKLETFKKKYGDNYAIIFPSASYQEKRMPFEKFLQLAEYIHNKYNLTTYICGNKEDKKIFQNFPINKKYVKDLCGLLKLSDLPYLFKNAKIVLTNDTCAMWIANCTKTNSVVFSNVFAADIQNLKIIDKEKGLYSYISNKMNFVFPNIVYKQMLNNGIGNINEPLETVSIDNAIYNIDTIMKQFNEF